MLHYVLGYIGLYIRFVPNRFRRASPIKPIPLLPELGPFDVVATVEHRVHVGHLGHIPLGEVAVKR